MTDRIRAQGTASPLPLQARYPELEGRVAVVTGAARGMGAAFAAGLADAGVTVFAGDLDADAQAATAAEISGRGRGTVTPAALDVRDPVAHDALASRAVEEHGRLDIWVNNAGIFPQAGVLDISPEQFQTTYAVNVEGVLYGAQAAGRHMVAHGGGAIVNMASIAAMRVRATRASYSTSKAAVDHLTRFLAVELGAGGVRVNAIAPGFIDTDMIAWVKEDPAAMEAAVDAIPLHRVGTPEDVLGALLFLVSDSAQYVTGQTLRVDGGSLYG